MPPTDLNKSLMTPQRVQIAAGIFIALQVIQINWIHLTLGQTGGYVQNAPAYFQAPAVAARQIAA